MAVAAAHSWLPSAVTVTDSRRFFRTSTRRRCPCCASNFFKDKGLLSCTYNLFHQVDRCPRGARERVFLSRAVQDSSPGKKNAPEPGVDTRIHWENEDEGWIGGRTSSKSEEDEKRNLRIGENDDILSDLLNTSSNSYYQFLGIGANADMEEIKSAYRRLSKEYHPDTTTLPIRAASEKFMKLREIYDVLSDEEKRKFYDWTLAQETAASIEAEKTRMMKLEDPYYTKDWESIPDMVDRLGGRNLELNEQAKQALTFDIVVIIFTICSIICYLVFFNQPSS